MSCRLEHANITVKDMEEGVRFLTTVFPDFQSRGGDTVEIEGGQKQWLHVGTDETYIALESVTPTTDSDRRPYRDLGINHIGFVVDDLDGVIARLVEAGYETGDLAEEIDYRKRTYVFDDNGVEWEFVQYLTEDAEKANVYQM
ncbi:MAG: VOC family protein [Candidatus Latescibacteria bacterium]|jgi:catechol 2,3-dioxygenase-like lactoylglutathione lyase family enzyme|nr:VOC family protein [Candidatus Latescibacterota bacterium]MBT4141489.1 VOC family protein [Candidatus Latescibacterota bacterium]MBT5831012.1 VOC family protein [Candidatus Latescibacterota bacterium]